MNIVPIEGENFSEVFRKAVAYDNVKSHKKARFHSLYIKQIFGKTTRRIKLIFQPF